MKQSSLFFSLIFGVALLLPCMSTRAQQINKWDRAIQKSDRTLAQLEVHERVHPGFDKPVHRLGGLLLRPSVSLLETLDTNVYATSTNQKTDLISVLSPELKVETENRNRGFRFNAASYHGRYKKYDGENFNDIQADINPYWILTRALKMTGQVAWQKSHELRTEEAATAYTGAEEPVTWQRSLGRIGWQYKPGALAMSMFAERAYLSFDNVGRIGGGAPFVNDDRNRYENKVQGEVSYEITDRSDIYCQAQWFNREYRRNDYNDIALAYNGLNRDSSGGQIVAGLRLPVTGLISADATIGYRTQDFDDTGLKDVSTPVANLALTWQMSPLTTIKVESVREVFETVQASASSYIQSRAGLQVAHELRRNIILDLDVNAGRNDYTGIDRDDDFISAGVGATYKMSRYLEWRASYYHDRRDSNDNAVDFDKDRIFLTAKVNF